MTSSVFFLASHHKSAQRRIRIAAAVASDGHGGYWRLLAQCPSSFIGGTSPPSAAKVIEAHKTGEGTEWRKADKRARHSVTLIWGDEASSERKSSIPCYYCAV